jgi:hypothetical protein
VLGTPTNPANLNSRWSNVLPSGNEPDKEMAEQGPSTGSFVPYRSDQVDH